MPDHPKYLIPNQPMMMMMLAANLYVTKPYPSSAEFAKLAGKKNRISRKNILKFVKFVELV